MKELYCRVCGYQESEVIWGSGEGPNFDFCCCCGVEHGYQDSTPIGTKNYRSKWISGGAKWELEKLKPLNWKLEIQLKNVTKEFG